MLYRVEVRSRADMPDPRGGLARAEAVALGLPGVPDRIETASVYLIEGALEPAMVDRLTQALLADPVTQEATVGAAPPRGTALIEVHPLPGVMDPDADAVELAIRTMLGVEASVRTGVRYDFHGGDPARARHIAERSLANSVIQQIHDAPYLPDRFPVAAARQVTSTEIPLRGLDADALDRLSRDAHLFLSTDEMLAIQAEYRRLGREPRDIELETLAQTWSEHCVHKTLKATVRFHGALPGAAERPGHEVQPDGSVVIRNLLSSTIAAATRELMASGIDWCLSVFVDNAGIIAFDDRHAVCFKVETHNHPSAIEPYGGAATGIGGCIRDILGTGLGARPIAATDVFCVAMPDRAAAEVPAGCLHPARILRQVVAGVRDYGNRMGIPTLNGTVWFDDRYIGNPLVYCGCVGVMPRDRITGSAQAGDLIVALGGRTGRDGIHGATFSSAELTDTHADEFAHAVQIGNAVTQKKMLDAIMEARDSVDTDGQRRCLFRAVTDCGAGGFSSAVGEMGEHTGAVVHLERAPLKYAGLSPTEIWISEAQERMVLAVDASDLDALRAVCDRHDVELCVLGRFGTDDRELILRFGDQEVGRLSMAFLHDGLPSREREARFSPAPRHVADPVQPAPAVEHALLTLLADPNIASKHWIVRQYDHEVQGRTVIKPLTGPDGHGPGDASVILPVPGSRRGLAIGCGLATGLSHDPYRMALAGVDECVRNIVCVGGDPARLAILDNFCWPSCRDPESMGSLVLAAEGCRDAALAYRTPFISGKDSLNNQFVAEDGTVIRIPPTLLISGFAIVPDVSCCVTMDLKRPGSLLLLVGVGTGALGGSRYEHHFGGAGGERDLPMIDLVLGPRLARSVARLIEHRLVRSAHDLSEGGLLVAAAEMAIGGGLGVELDPLQAPADGEMSEAAELFGESPGRYLLEVDRADLPRIDALLGDLPWAIVGEVLSTPEVRISRGGPRLPIADLHAAWHGTLDW